MVGRWLHGFSELLADGSRREAADGLLLAAAEIPHLHCLPLKLAGMAGGSSRVDPLWEEEEEEEADQTCVPLLYPGKTRRVTTIPPCRPIPPPCTWRVSGGGSIERGVWPCMLLHVALPGHVLAMQCLG